MACSPSPPHPQQPPEVVAQVASEFQQPNKYTSIFEGSSEEKSGKKRLTALFWGKANKVAKPPGNLKNTHNPAQKQLFSAGWGNTGKK
jgi:hypothetical protein